MMALGRPDNLMTRYSAWKLILIGLLLAVRPSLAETGYDAWLRYPGMEEAKRQYGWLPAVSVALGDSSVVRSAQEELHRGVNGMLGRTMRAKSDLPEEGAIMLGTLDVMTNAIPAIG